MVWNSMKITECSARKKKSQNCKGKLYIYTIVCYEQVHDQKYTEVSDMMFIGNVRELECF